MNLKFNGHKQNYLGWWWQEQEHRVTGEIEWGRSNQQESEWDRPKIEWFRDKQCWRQYQWLMSAARDFSGHRMEEKKRSGGERDRGWRETLFRRLMWDQHGWEMKMVKEYPTALGPKQTEMTEIISKFLIHTDKAIILESPNKRKRLLGMKSVKLKPRGLKLHINFLRSYLPTTYVYFL